MKINKKIDHKNLWLNSMIGMTWGFIASLITGTIIGLFALGHKSGSFYELITNIKHMMSYITGFAIGIGIGIKLKLSPLQIFALGLTSFIVGQSTFHPHYANGIVWEGSIGINTLLKLPGDVFGAWLAGIVIAYLFAIVKWKTFLDILIVPILGAIMGIILSTFLTYMTSTVVVLLEWTIKNTIGKSHIAAIFLAPILGAIMGLALTLPTSSAAIAFALHLTGDAATAAMAATAAQMISFGVMTYLTTKSINQTIAVSIGTSMLQMKNFSKKPILLLIPLILSMVTALLAVAIVPLDFPIRGVTSGMGSAGLYGQIFTLSDNGWGNWKAYINVFAIQLAIPLLLTLPLGLLFIKKKWILPKDMELTYG